MSFVIPGIAVADVPKFAWKLHDTETDTRDPPTRNVYHEIFDLSGGQKFHYIVIEHNNDEHDAKDIDVRLTIDGEVYETIGKTMLENELFYLWFDDIGSDPPAHTLEMDETLIQKFGFAITDQTCVTPARMTNVKLEVKITSALGTNQTVVTRYRRSSLEAV